MESEQKREAKQRQTVVAIIVLISMLVAGCTRVNSRVRQKDGTYRETTHLVFKSDLPDLTFRSQEDYMVASSFNGVTYAWPKGKGQVSKDFAEIRFSGRDLACRAISRRLSVNGRWYGEFEEGDSVRITGDGKVFVNDTECSPASDM